MLVAIRTDVAESIQMVDALIKLTKSATGRRGRALMAEIMEFEHKWAFEVGGWQDYDGGEAWTPTHPFWVKHLEGKTSNKPLVWTGNAKKSIRGVVTADGVEVRGASYLGKFQFGPQRFTEKFPAVRDASGDWQKVSGFGDFMMTREIRVQEREVFAFFPEFADRWMMELSREAGFGIHA